MNIETKSNLATDLAALLDEAVHSEHNPCHADGEPTRVMIELPNDECVPVSYAWYDKENNIVRLSYDES